MKDHSTLSGQTLSASRCTPMAGVHIVGTDATGKELARTETKSDGNWILPNIGGLHKVKFLWKDQKAKSYKSNSVPPIVRIMDDPLVGYQKRLWFLPGETVKVFVHANSEYKAKLTRFGLKREIVSDLGRHNKLQQITPDGFFVDKGLDWDAAFSYTIPKTATPGLYGVVLKTVESAFVIPFILSTPADQRGRDSSLLVLASTNTWQSYNIWGGRSRYRNFESARSQEFLRMARWKDLVRKVLPDSILRVLARLTHEPPWKFKRLSIKRPFPFSGLDQLSVTDPFTNHLAGAEWRLLAWLEREGFQYDIISGVEFHREPAILDNYKTILFNTHCEYWTRQMYEGLVEWHTEKGGWIVNAGANSIYREIEVFDDGSTRCVSLSFNRSCADESQILGVRFTPDDYGTSSAYKVIEPDHWIFTGTELKKGEAFGEDSLNRNLLTDKKLYRPDQPGIAGGLRGRGGSGWETDKLTRTAPEDMKLVAKGMNPHGGAEMVLREPHVTRGGMFSASSITFSGSLLIDPIVSKLTRTFLEKSLNVILIDTR